MKVGEEKHHQSTIKSHPPHDKLCTMKRNRARLKVKNIVNKTFIMELLGRKRNRLQGGLP